MRLRVPELAYWTPIMRWLSTLLTLLPFTAAAADLEVGQKALDFTLQGADGAAYTLAEHVGKRGVVLAWFPKAFTPG